MAAANEISLVAAAAALREEATINRFIGQSCFELYISIKIQLQRSF